MAENEIMRQKVWVAYDSGEDGVLAVRYTAEEAQQVVLDVIEKTGDQPGRDWRYGAHGVWSVRSKDARRDYFVERFHFDMPRTPDMSDVRPENEKEGIA